MTIYTPDIESRFGPKYRIIADAICDDIRDNRLNAGTKLPTHRDLAYRLGVTVGTITRAYAELQRRGIAGGRVGSGTYVLDPQETRRTFRSPSTSIVRHWRATTIVFPWPTPRTAPSIWR